VYFQLERGGKRSPSIYSEGNGMLSERMPDHTLGKGKALLTKIACLVSALLRLSPFAELPPCEPLNDP